MLDWVDSTNTSHLADIIADNTWEINYLNPAECVTTTAENGTTSVAGCDFVTNFVGALGVEDNAATFGTLWPNTTGVDVNTFTYETFNWGVNSSYEDAFTVLEEVTNITNNVNSTLRSNEEL